jgi:transcriptional regulator with XRE-family HTH domain
LPFCHLRLRAEKPKDFRYPTELKTLGDHLRKRRLDLGLLQREVARVMGVSAACVWQWETHYSSVQTHLIPRVIDFLGYAPWEAPAHFGGWFQMVRLSLGLSRKRLGRRYHIDEATLWRLESGRSWPTRQTAARLRDLLSSIASGAPTVRRRGRTQLLS